MTIRIGPVPIGREPEVITLVRDVFSASEGAAEGRAIGELAEGLVLRAPATERWCDVVERRGQILATAIYSRLRYPGGGAALVLGPVAVATTQQRQGYGMRLLHDGIAARFAAGEQWVLTYGDPEYYSRVGFDRLAEKAVSAPYPLTMPHGWLLHASSSSDLGPLAGVPRPVQALADPHYW